MTDELRGDEWWRLENRLFDHRNAAVWGAVIILALAVVLFTDCESLLVPLGIGSLASCPAASTGADLAVAVGTAALAYSAFVTMAQAERESSRSREAHIRVWARSHSEQGAFVPPPAQANEVVSGPAGLGSVFIDNIGPGIAELVNCSAHWTYRGGSPAPRTATSGFPQPYLAKDERFRLLVPRELQEALTTEAEGSVVDSIRLEVKAHGFGGAFATSPWLVLRRQAATLTPALPYRQGGQEVQPTRHWQWAVVAGKRPDEPPVFPP